MSARLRALGREAVEIAERGHYPGPDGPVRIADQVARAVAGTRLHLPGDELPEPAAAGGPPRIEVTAESTLWAARRLGGNPACLNFASARNPGGGFLNGAQAQEESLARSSALYPCLLAAGDFYAHHRAERSLLYTDRIIYASAVPVFRDDKGRLLPTAYPVSFLVSAAPNRSAIARNQPESLPEIGRALGRRATRVLRVAAAHGYRDLVLGAWGCGVFGNDPAEVARAFAGALAVSPWFDRVVFAILDRGGATRQAFEQVFRS
ncbi:TIGR02452 family protein [Actinoplanes oblitus]|uniref:TIGR02452 family protein n=1 Tax=Actinoplanes oblitus TaxID=3040509 RepID=A0ABY8WE29_9ACTN|nr:TIGR02452 family protein [Actinoplanes oblitus]WIM93975.1 TIGR02452 family protein [Actinoplanes oblitus]